MYHDPITRPKGLREEILLGNKLLEYYSEPAQPGLREFWSYLILVERYDHEMRLSGAGAICNRNHGLVQTLSFTAAEMQDLRRRLEVISLPVMPPGVFTLDGCHGHIRIYHGDDSRMDLHWAGSLPDEWNAIQQWIDEVWKLIEDKAFDDSFDAPPMGAESQTGDSQPDHTDSAPST